MTNVDQKIICLKDLLDHDSRDMISAEIHLKSILPRWTVLVHAVKLKLILDRYLMMVDQHITNLATFIEEEKISSPTIRNRVMQSMVKQTEERLNSCAESATKDACLLGAIQSMNHFKICIYGRLASYATALGMERFSAVFHAAKANERQIDDRLSQLAETEINAKAKSTAHI